MKTPASKRARPAPVVDLFEVETVWVSVARAAKRADYSTRNIKRWITAGLLSATRSPSPKGRGHLRIRLGDLESLMARGVRS